jgi:amino acid adenylation domain-containing protein/non-ribosomal peptide synthase protein (TIGR01720 family)
MTTDLTMNSRTEQPMHLCESKRTVHSLFEAQVDRRPAAVAVSYGQQEMNYGDLNRKANRLARYLLKQGVSLETPVGIHLQRSVEMVIAALGVLKAGGAYVPLDPEYPSERLSQMIQDASAPLVITSQSAAGGLPPSSAKVLLIDAEWGEIEGECDSNPQISVAADNLAYIIYTSGSTGTPKGVSISHRAIVRTTVESNYLQLQEDDVVAQISRLSFDASSWEIWGSLLAGSRLAIVEAGVLLSPILLRRELQDKGVTALLVITSLLHEIAREEPGTFLGVRHLLFGGESADPKLIREILHNSRPGRMLHLYGPAECTTYATWHLVEKLSDEVTRVPIGKPVSKTGVYLLDETLKPVPDGMQGEIYLDGDGLARGYHHRPSETAAVFLPNPFGPSGSRMYKTGDFGRTLDGGKLEFIGRVDEQVKVRGFRIETGEVEAALRKYPSVREAVVTTRKTAIGSDQLVAYVSSSEKNIASDLHRFLSATLPPFMIPSIFFAIETFPRTPGGKIDRRELSKLGSKSMAGVSSGTPRSATETLLTEVWETILSVSPVGVDDNFFELGGDSILSMQMVSLASERGLFLRATDTVECQTIAELAARAETVKRIEIDQSVVTGPAPLAPPQAWHFARNQETIDRYNMVLQLEATDHIDVEAMQRAVRALFTHHDSLRLRFQQTSEGWIQVNGGLEAIEPLVCIDFSESSDGDCEEAIDAVAEVVQDEFNTTRGPLIRFVLIEFSPPKRPRLLLITHHLVADAISLRILLEDLSELYQAGQARLPAKLPLKTTAFRNWAIWLQDFSEKGGFDDEIPYWREQIESGWPDVPDDFVCDRLGDRERDTRTVKMILDHRKTTDILQRITSSTQSSVQELLLTALGRVLLDWSGKDSVAIDLSTHGRAELGPELDLRRTSGWFSTLFPFVLERAAAPSFELQLRETQSRLRRIPRGGVGYQALANSREKGQALITEPESRREICFAYLGQLDELVPSRFPFQMCSQPSARTRAADSPRTYGVEVMAAVTRGEIQFEFSYSRARHAESTIAALADSLRDELTHLTSWHEHDRTECTSRGPAVT